VVENTSFSEADNKLTFTDTKPLEKTLPRALMSCQSAQKWQRLIEAKRVHRKKIQPNQLVARYWHVRRRVERGSRLLHTLQAVAAADRSLASRLYGRAREFENMLLSECARIESGNEQIAPIELMRNLADQYFELINRTRAQACLLTKTDLLAQQLHESIGMLFRDRAVPLAPFQNLARQVLVDVSELRHPIAWIQERGIASRSFLGTRFPNTTSFVYGGSIQAARFVALFLQKNVRWESRAEQIVVAMLLQDIGLIAAESAYGMEPLRLAIENPNAYARHPSVGAAMAAAINGLSIEIPFLMATHHEHQDGSGFPRRLAGRQLGECARLAGIVTRFVELLDTFSRSSAKDNLETDARPDLLLNAAWQLRREAKQREYDAAITDAFLRQLDGTLLETLESMASRPSNRDSVMTGHDGVRIDGAHSGPLAHMTFLRSQMAEDAAEDK